MNTPTITVPIRLDTAGLANELRRVATALLEAANKMDPPTEGVS